MDGNSTDEKNRGEVDGNARSRAGGGGGVNKVQWRRRPRKVWPWSRACPVAKTEAKYLPTSCSQRYQLNATVFVFEIDAIHVGKQAGGQRRRVPRQCHIDKGAALVINVNTMAKKSTREPLISLPVFRRLLQILRAIGPRGQLAPVTPSSSSDGTTGVFSGQPSVTAPPACPGSPSRSHPLVVRWIRWRKGGDRRDWYRGGLPPPGELLPGWGHRVRVDHDLRPPLSTQLLEALVVRLQTWWWTPGVRDAVEHCSINGAAGGYWWVLVGTTRTGGSGG